LWKVPNQARCLPDSLPLALSLPLSLSISLYLSLSLAGVPWERRDVELDAKIDQFFDEFNRLGDLNERERSMNILYFVLSAAQLLRFVV